MAGVGKMVRMRTTFLISMIGAVFLFGFSAWQIMMNVSCLNENQTKELSITINKLVVDKPAQVAHIEAEGYDQDFLIVSLKLFGKEELENAETFSGPAKVQVFQSALDSGKTVLEIQSLKIGEKWMIEEGAVTKYYRSAVFNSLGMMVFAVIAFGASVFMRKKKVF